MVMDKVGVIEISGGVGGGVDDGDGDDDDVSVGRSRVGLVAVHEVHTTVLTVVAQQQLRNAGVTFKVLITQLGLNSNLTPFILVNLGRSFQKSKLCLRKTSFTSTYVPSKL